MTKALLILSPVGLASALLLTPVSLRAEDEQVLEEAPPLESQAEPETEDPPSYPGIQDDSSEDVEVAPESSESPIENSPGSTVDEGTSSPASPSPLVEQRPAASSESPSTKSRRRPDASFGFGVGAVPEFGSTNQYETFYGSTQRMIQGYAGYYLLSYGVDLGLIGRLGYYTDRGHPLKALPAGQTLPVESDLPDGVLLDKNQDLELTLIPIQLSLDVAFSPFASRRIVLRAWGGFEQLYVQEILKPNLPSASGTQSVSSFKNTGWNTGLATGFMLSISLHGIEPRSDYALRAIGIDRTYVSPFVEVLTTRDNRMGNFDRQTYGIAFSFESLR